MPFVEAGQRMYPLRAGENLLGAGPECDVRLPDLRTRDRVAIAVEELGAFVWATGEDGAAAINGRPLSAEATPLFHGDRILIDGATLVFVDDDPASVQRAADRAAGAGPDPAGAASAAPRQRAAPADGNGAREPAPRVVGVLRNLGDGRNYVIDREGFRLGREKRCDIVIPDPAVSRLHAEISFVRGNYLLRDLGRTGTKVNGRKISEPHRLQVGDTIEVGGHEFAFSRRPVDAEGLIRQEEITPIRNQVPDAPTVGVNSLQLGGGTSALTWILLAIAMGLGAWFVLTL